MKCSVGFGCSLILTATLLLIFTQPAGAVPDNEQSWIYLERDRPEEARARTLHQNDFLSRWVLAAAEVRVQAEPSANDPVSIAARAFEGGDFKLAEEILNPMKDAASDADQLYIRLFLGVCKLELDAAAEAEAMLNLAMDQAITEKRFASRCFGQLNRGRAYAHLNQVEKAEDDLQATIKLSRRLETHRWAAMAALALSDISHAVDNPDDVLYWLEAALQYYRHAEYRKGQIHALQALGEALCAMGECEEGLVYLDEAQAMAQTNQ